MNTVICSKANKLSRALLLLRCHVHQYLAVLLFLFWEYLSTESRNSRYLIGVINFKCIILTDDQLCPNFFQQMLYKLKIIRDRNLMIRGWRLC